MHRLVRLLLVAICLTFFGWATTTWGDEISSGDTTTFEILERLNALERENAALRREVMQIKEEKKLPAVAAAASEHQLPPVELTEEGYGLSVYGEYLFWNVTEDVDYVLTQSGTGPVTGEIKNAAWNWKSGVRVGGSLLLPNRDGWEIGARYTYYRGDGSASFVNPATNSAATRLHPDGLSGVGDDNVGFASIDLDLDFDQLEVEIGRRFWISESLSTRLFGGPHFVWIDRDYSTVYCSSTDCLGLFTTIARVDEKLALNAYGLRIGVDGDWHIWRGLSLFGGIAGSAMFGEFEWKNRELVVVADVVQVDVMEDFNRFVPVLQLNAGVGYRHSLNERVSLKGMLGWEAQKFWGFNNTRFVDAMMESANISEAEDLTLHGLTVRLRLDF